MGGVDLSDMLIALYRTPFRSHRWYLIIFAQLLDICLLNAWLVYRRDMESKKAEQEEKLKKRKLDEQIEDVTISGHGTGFIEASNREKNKKSTKKIDKKKTGKPHTTTNNNDDDVLAHMLGDERTCSRPSQQRNKKSPKNIIEKRPKKGRKKLPITVQNVEERLVNDSIEEEQEVEIDGIVMIDEFEVLDLEDGLLQHRMQDGIVRNGSVQDENVNEDEDVKENGAVQLKTGQVRRRDDSNQDGSSKKKVQRLRNKRKIITEERVKILSLKEFRATVAEQLFRYSNIRKRNGKNPITREKTPPLPTAGILGVQHLPICSSKGRCRHCKDNQTIMMCSLCEKRFCIVPSRNCFLEHVEKLDNTDDGEKKD